MDRLKHIWNRRQFVQTAGSFAAVSLAKPLQASAATAASVSIIVDPNDSVANAAPAVWAAKEMERALADQHVTVSRSASIEQAAPGSLCVIVAGAATSQASDLLKSAGTSVPSTPAALGLVPGRVGSRTTVLACGSDARGLAYALLELADRVDCGNDPMAALEIKAPFIERPVNSVRSNRQQRGE